MKAFDVLCAILLVVGGLNWGLWGLLEFDLVATIFGGNTAMLAKVVYTLVGVAAVYQIVSIAGIQKRWNAQPRIAKA